MPQWKLIKSQHGLEATAGTLVPATFLHKGNATLKINDAITTPELEYSLGVLGGNVEGAFIADTGSTLTWSDCDFSATDMVWLGNMAIKALPGAATSFEFAFPTTAANAIKYFTHELETATQEYEFGYGFVESFNIHGDVGSDNGRIMYNAVIQGRAAAAAAVTASLGFLVNVYPLNVNYASVHFDTIGTAAGTAAATTAYMRAFSLDVKTGWTVDAARYADGRSAKDFSTPIFTDYSITGNMKCVFGAQAVTHIAAARAGTPAAMAIKCQGTTARIVTFKLPMVFTETPEIGTNDGGSHVVEFPFRVAYSRTTTAQGPIILCDTVSSVTVT